IDEHHRDSPPPEHLHTGTILIDRRNHYPLDPLLNEKVEILRLANRIIGTVTYHDPEAVPVCDFFSAQRKVHEEWIIEVCDRYTDGANPSRTELPGALTGAEVQRFDH